MKKSMFKLTAVLGFGAMTVPAMALPTFPNGPWTFDVEDRSSIYHEPGGLVAPIATGDFLRGAGAAGGLGHFSTVVSPAIVGPVTQRSIFRLKDVNTGTVDPVGKFGMTEIATATFVDSFDTATSEGTGIASGHVLKSHQGLSGLSGAGSNDALIGARLYFSADTRFGFADTVPSLAANFGKGLLDPTGLATLGAGFGGIVKLYSDGTVDAFFDNGLGESGWGDLGAAAVLDPSYPFFNDAADGSVLEAIGVLTPLLTPDTQVPAPNALLAALIDGNFGLGTYAAAEAAALAGPSPAVLIEDFSGPGGGEGVAFVNIISATPGFLSTFTPDFFGAGRDLRLDFQTSVSLGPDGADGNPATPLNGLPDQINFVDADHGANGGPGWGVRSTDPVQGSRGVIPEPVSASLSLMAVGALGAYSTRRRNA